MNEVKTVFSQLIGFLPNREFSRRVAPVSGLCSNHIEGAPGPSPGKTQEIDREISFPQCRLVSCYLPSTTEATKCHAAKGHFCGGALKIRVQQLIQFMEIAISVPWESGKRLFPSLPWLSF
jgi:hypothetical protein